jgi:putative ABC transport system ATP-binding protein
MVTHDPFDASYGDRIIFPADGQIVDQMTGPTPETVLDRLKRLDPWGSRLDPPPAPQSP